MKIGYARTASTHQNVDEQIRKLRAAGCVEVFTDQGKLGKSHDGLGLALLKLQAGYALVVCSVDRLSRSTIDVLKILDDLKARDIEFQVLDQPEFLAGEMSFPSIGILAAAEYIEAKKEEAASAELSPLRHVAWRVGKFLTGWSGAEHD